MKKMHKGNDGILAGLFSVVLGALKEARERMPEKDNIGEGHLADITKNYLDNQGKKKARFVPANAEIDKQFRAIMSSIAALAKSLGLENVKPLEIGLDKNKARPIMNKFNLSDIDWETWSYIYTFGYYPMSLDGKCVSWKESLKEFAKVVKSAESRNKRVGKKPKLSAWP